MQRKKSRTDVFTNLYFSGELILQLNICRILFRALNSSDIIKGEINIIREILRLLSPPVEESTYYWPEKGTIYR